MIWLLCGYVWLAVHRPFEVWPWVGALQVERWYMLLTMAAWVAAPKDLRWDRLASAFCVLIASISLSWFLNGTDEEGWSALENLLKTFVFFYLATTSVRSERELKILAAAFLVSTSLYLGHSLREYVAGRYVWRMGTARMIGVDLSYGNPNALAATVACALPMIRPFWRATDSRAVRAGLLGFAILGGACVLLTGSRWGLVTFLIAILFTVGLSRKGVKWLMLIAAVAPLFFFALPADRQRRFLTLVDPSYGPANAQVSADSRIELLKIAYELWQQRPLIGYGPLSFPSVSGTGHPPHTLYGQLISESGLAGVGGMALVLLAFLANALRVRRVRGGADGPSFPSDVNSAAVATVVLLLLQGLSGHNLYRYTWVWMGVFQILAVRFVRGPEAGTPPDGDAAAAA